MPKKPATTNQAPEIIDVTEEAEQGQAVTELSKKEVIAQVRANIRNRRNEIQADEGALAQLRSDKIHQRDLLIRQRDEAEEHFHTMKEEEQAAAGRVVREQSRVQYSQGIPQAEQEHKGILEALIADFDAAKARTEASEKARVEAYARAKIIPALDTAISEIQAQIADIGREQTELVELDQEQHRAMGLALADEVKADIEAAKAAKEEALQCVRSAEEEEAYLQSRIFRKLEEWPDLAEQLHFSHGDHSPKPPKPAEKIVKAYLDYVEVLQRHGSVIILRDDRGAKKSFFQTLDLNPGMQEGFAENQRELTGRVELARQLLEQERNRHTSW